MTRQGIDRGKLIGFAVVVIIIGVALVRYSAERSGIQSSTAEESVPTQTASQANKNAEETPVDEYKGAEEAIEERCKSKWATDFEMQRYCQKQHKAALVKLKKGKPDDIPEDTYSIVHRNCAGKWKDDFEMRAYCEKTQFQAFRDLRDKH